MFNNKSSPSTGGPGGGGGRGPQNRGQQMGNMPQQPPAANIFPHQQNLQQMDQSELKDLLMQVIQFAPDIASMSAQGGSGPQGLG